MLLITLHIVSKLHNNLKVPVFCKIRILPKEEDTIALAKLIEKAGCQVSLPELSE